MTNKQAYIFGKKKVRDLNRPVAVPVGVSNVEMIMVPGLKKNVWRMFVKTLDDCIPRTEKLPNGKIVTTDAPFKYPYKKGLAVQSFTKDEKSGVIEIEYVAFPKLFKDTYKIIRAFHNELEIQIIQRTQQLIENARNLG